MDFVVVDVETANAGFSSICQVGMAFFRDREYVRSWSSLVDPYDYFDAINVSIHGIDEEAVRGAPMWPSVYRELTALVGEAVVVSHSSFDRTAIFQACGRHSVEPPGFTWLDSARVVRRAWPLFSKNGYGLASVAKHFGIEFRHHDAAEDARAAGEILVRAMAETGLDVGAWLERVDRHSLEPLTREASPEGPLLGQTVVFTGALSMPRREAADLAALAGCAVDASVTKSTTVLVVGDQDILRLAGQEKSTKHRKAEKLICEGQSIRIIGESDFRRLVAIH
jgi:DNA polymerase-3 subunit epsilon